MGSESDCTRQDTPASGIYHHISCNGKHGFSKPQQKETNQSKEQYALQVRVAWLFSGYMNLEAMPGASRDSAATGSNSGYIQGSPNFRDCSIA